MLDFHSHLIPSVDDGAADLEESRVGLAAMAAEGVTTIVTTPHIAASLVLRPADYERYLNLVEAQWQKLLSLAAAEFPGLRLERGMEVMLDIPNADLSDLRLHLAGSSFILVEFPFMNVPPNSAASLRHIRADGFTPIVAHPERYSNISGQEGLIEEWRAVGAGIQVNCGSLVGRYGSTAKRIAWLALQHGWADYLSSDYHARGRCLIQESAKALRMRGGASQLRALTVDNPRGILRSEAPHPVPYLEDIQTSFWQRVFSRA